MLVYLLITALVVTATKAVQIQSCECSLCTCTVPAEPKAAPKAASTDAPKTAPAASPTPTPTPAPKTAATTPLHCGDWVKHGGKCYMFILRKRNFNGASEYCKDLGGQLVSIHSEKENKFVHNLVTSEKGVSTQKLSFHCNMHATKFQKYRYFQRSARWHFDGFGVFIFYTQKVKLPDLGKAYLHKVVLELESHMLSRSHTLDLTAYLFRWYVRIYPRIIISKSHGNTLLTTFQKLSPKGQLPLMTFRWPLNHICWCPMCDSTQRLLYCVQLPW